jgi:hypothetical protein
LSQAGLVNWMRPSASMISRPSAMLLTMVRRRSACSSCVSLLLRICSCVRTRAHTSAMRSGLLM